MTTLHVYLTFNGNCREAMNFYKQSLGGALELQTIGSSPLANKMPTQMREYILHATLTNNNMILMGSDMTPSKGLFNGNKVSLSLNCSSEDEVHSYYQRLSEGGSKDHPPEYSFWGAVFGDLTDKYGHHWILNYFHKN